MSSQRPPTTVRAPLGRPPVRRGPRTLTLALLLPLGSCLTDVLFPARDEQLIELTDRGVATMTLEAIGTADAGDATAVVVRTGEARGRVAAGWWGERTVRTAYRLEPEGSDLAAPLVDVLARGVLGPVDECTVDLEWTMSPRRYEIWSGRIDVRGTFSDALRGCRLEPSAARTLVADAPRIGGAVPGLDPDDRDVQAAVDAAAHIDWRVLMPLLASGSGTVLAVVAAGDTASPHGERDLVVQAGEDDPTYLRVPAAAVAALRTIDRDPGTLCDRFVFFARCRPRPSTAADAQLEPVSFPAIVRLTTRLENRARRYGWFLDHVVIPTVQAIENVTCYLLDVLLPGWRGERTGGPGRVRPDGH